MDSLYEHVIPPQHRKSPRGRYTLIILLGLILVAFILYLYPLVRMILHKEHYKQFLSEFSTATYQSYQKGTLTAEVDGVTMTLTEHNAYGLYQTIAKQGPCYISNDQPDREPDAQLQYGIFYTLDLWEVPLEDDPNDFESGVYVRFSSTGQQGTDFSYLMVGCTMRDLLTRYLSPGLNEAS